MQDRSNVSVCSRNWKTSMYVCLAGGERSADVCGGVLLLVFFFLNLTGICILLVTIMQNTKPRIL